jgi:sodium/bile acid cotransporter 7
MNVTFIVKFELIFFLCFMPEYITRLCSLFKVILVRNAGGNDYAALLNALFGNILGVFVTPAMIYFFMSTAGLGVIKQSYDISSYLHVVGTLSLTVLLPLVVGLIINRIWTEQLMWAKVKFHFTEINSVALLILVWAVFCDLFQSGLLKTVNTYDLLTVMALNASFYILFSFFALFIGRVPNLCVCRKENHDEEPLLSEHQPKKASLIERWRFSREDTIALMFCSSTKTLAKGVPVIAAVFANSNQGLIGLLSLPLILYHIEQLMLGSIEVLLLQRWLKQHHNDDSKETLQK